MLDKNVMDNKVEIFNLNTILDYQKGSIVSRALINKNEGNVTLFSFDKNEGLSEHTTPYDALVYIFEGKAKISISRKDYIVEKGQMIIMPANEPHALKALEKFKMMLIMIKAK